jgi:carboxypeptidase Taq
VSAPRAYETLRTKLGEIHDIVKSASLLGWDQQVLMPSRGGEARSYQLATLGKLAHELFISEEIGSLLEELRSYEESLGYESLDASLIRVARLDYEKAARVPPELSAEITRVGAQSFGVWVEARAKSDYESFRPWLEQLVELKHRYVECYPPGDVLYDRLLDDYARSSTG